MGDWVVVTPRSQESRQLLGISLITHYKAAVRRLSRVRKIPIGDRVLKSLNENIPSLLEDIVIHGLSLLLHDDIDDADVALSRKKEGELSNHCQSIVPGDSLQVAGTCYHPGRMKLFS